MSTPALAERNEVVVLGVVLAPHGVRGWVKVRTHTADPAALLRYRAWWLRPPSRGQWEQRDVDDSRPQGNLLAAKLRGVADREAAAALRGWEVGVPRQSMPAPAPGEIYWTDLVGMRVANRSGATLGEVAGLVEHGAHPLLRVVRSGGAAGPERLIPYVPAIVVAIDVVGRRIEVDWGEDY